MGMSKSEEKREQEMTAPGQEKKVKFQLTVASQDVTSVRQKMKKYAWKYAHLGIQWKVPASLEHALTKAKLAKVQTEALLKKLEEERNSPENQRLKTSEMEAKAEWRAEEDKTRGLKKEYANEKKTYDEAVSNDKKRREVDE